MDNYLSSPALDTYSYSETIICEHHLTSAPSFGRGDQGGRSHAVGGKTNVRGKFSSCVPALSLSLSLSQDKVRNGKIDFLLQDFKDLLMKDNGDMEYFVAKSIFRCSVGSPESEPPLPDDGIA